MTDACEFSTDPKFPAAKVACDECPVRRSNVHKPSAAGWYEQGNFEGIWRDITQGSFLGCHKFDGPATTGYSDVMEAQGYKRPTNLEGRKECAGMAALIQREIEAAKTYPNFDSYIKARPTGLQRAGWELVRNRLNGDGLPLTAPADQNSADLITPAEHVRLDSMHWLHGETKLFEWASLANSLADEHGFPKERDCTCRVCTNHNIVHPAKDLTTADGATVQVDVILHPLLEALASAGIRTTASCENLHDAMQKLWPEQIPIILNPEPGTVNYAGVVAERQAVIRFKVGEPLDAALIKQLHLAEWAVTETTRIEAQSRFHLEHLDSFLAIVEAIR